jgi:hypothetical protein
MRRESVAPGTPSLTLARLKLPVRATSTNKAMSCRAERFSIGLIIPLMEKYYPLTSISLIFGED